MLLSPLAAPGPGQLSRPCGGPVTARFPPPVLHLLHLREGGNSTLTSQGEVRAAHCMQGLGTLGARRGGPGQSRDPSPGNVLLEVPGWSHTWPPPPGSRRRGKRPTGPRSSGFPWGSERRSMPVAEEKPVSSGSLRVRGAWAHLPVLPTRVRLRVPGRRGCRGQAPCGEVSLSAHPGRLSRAAPFLFCFFSSDVAHLGSVDPRQCEKQKPQSSST